jgi:hypothetical protein
MLNQKRFSFLPDAMEQIEERADDSHGITSKLEVRKKVDPMRKTYTNRGFNDAARILYGIDKDGYLERILNSTYHNKFNLEEDSQTLNRTRYDST